MNSSTMKVSIKLLNELAVFPEKFGMSCLKKTFLIGIASISTTPESYFLHFITVMPDDRGKGYGSLMLQTICDRFNDKPIHLELDASSPLGVDKLRAWYEKHGFVYLGGENMVRDASPLCKHFKPLWSH
jgi:GNAT superfamily N-acetyltransferase